MGTNDKNLEIYGGELILKYVNSNDQHAYYIAERNKKTGEVGKFIRKSGVTTYIGIKDKSGPLKYWAVKLMWKHLKTILNDRAISKFDLDEAKGLHTVRLKEAATIGTKIHDWIEEYVKGNKPPMPDEANVLQGVNAWLSWVEKNKIHFIASELMLYSKKYDFCGQMDYLAYVGDKWWELYVGDYKTSNGLYNDVMLQTAAYSKALIEMGLLQTIEDQGIDKEWLKKAKKTPAKVKVVGRHALRIEKRSPDEFREEMDEKGNVNAEYKPFEYALLDPEYRIDKDFDAFVAFQTGHLWNKETDKLIQELIS